MPSYTQYKRQIMDADDNIETWITVKGNHIPIMKGQSKEEAVQAFLEKKGGKSSGGVKTVMKPDIEKPGSTTVVSKGSGTPKYKVGDVTKQGKIKEVIPARLSDTPYYKLENGKTYLEEELREEAMGKLYKIRPGESGIKHKYDVGGTKGKLFVNGKEYTLKQDPLAEFKHTPGSNVVHSYYTDGEKLAKWMEGNLNSDDMHQNFSEQAEIMSGKKDSTPSGEYKSTLSEKEDPTFKQRTEILEKMKGVERGSKEYKELSKQYMSMFPKPQKHIERKVSPMNELVGAAMGPERPKGEKKSPRKEYKKLVGEGAEHYDGPDQRMIDYVTDLAKREKAGEKLSKTNKAYLEQWGKFIGTKTDKDYNKDYQEHVEKERAEAQKKRDANLAAGKKLSSELQKNSSLWSKSEFNALREMAESDDPGLQDVVKKVMNKKIGESERYNRPVHIGEAVRNVVKRMGEKRKPKKELEVPDIRSEYRHEIAILENKAKRARKMGQGHTAMRLEDQVDKLYKELNELDD